MWAAVLNGNISKSRNLVNYVGCSKLKKSVDMTSSGRMVSILEQMQVKNWAGPGIRRSKRPLLASRTLCKWPKETSWTMENNVKNGTLKNPTNVYGFENPTVGSTSSSVRLHIYVTSQIWLKYR